MIKSYSKHIAILLAAGMFMLGSLTAEAAVVYRGMGEIAPGMPFWPEGNSIGSGKLKIFPELAVGLVYNDNIFYDNSNKESDTITHVIPRLRIDYSLEERGSIRLGYAGDFAFYADFSDNDWQKHEIGFELDYNAPSGLFLDVANNYVNTSDPFGSQDDYALGDQKDRWYNLFGAGLGYNHDDRLKVIGYFNYNKQEYDDKENDYSQNFDGTIFGVGLEKRVAQKTWGFARYFHGERDYNTKSPAVPDDDDNNENESNSSNDADYADDSIFFGLTWDTTSRITGKISFGYGWRQYDNKLDPSDKPYEDDDTWLAVTSINYSLKPGVTDLHFGFRREMHSRGSDTTENYDGTYFDTGLSHRFYSWYKLLVNFGIGDNNYNDGRNDNDYRAGIGVEYLMHRRVTLAIGYDYERRDSNERDESFTINRILGTVTLRY